jgi:hypothetical protein
MESGDDTFKKMYFDTEAEKLSLLGQDLYSEEKTALSEEEFAEYDKAFREARRVFRNEYLLYAQSIAKKIAQEEFDDETGRKYIAKLDKAGADTLLHYQENVNHNLELYEGWEKLYLQGGYSSFCNGSNTSERISINDLKALYFKSLLKEEIDCRVCQINTEGNGSRTGNG